MGGGRGAPFALGLAGKSRAVLLQMPPLRALLYSWLQWWPHSLALPLWSPLQGWGDVGNGGDVGQVSAPLSLSLLLSHSSASAMQSSRRRSAVPTPVTIDLTEEDSQDSSQSSSTLSGSSSQEGQNGSAELGAEEAESRDMGMALEYQVWRG